MPTYTHRLANGISFDMARIPKGEFRMGSQDADANDDEQPVHHVRITHDFYMGIFPVTQAVWKAVMKGDNPSYRVGNDRPVEQVSWNDIVRGDAEKPETRAFLDGLNQDSAPTEEELKGWQFRLPTEAEWEYAARAGTSYTYAGGDKLKEVGWYNHNSHRETKPVGLKKPNAWGLYDMSGNVYEWCWDWADYENYYRECQEKGRVDDPAGPNSGDHRVIRGGFYFDSPRDCRVSRRYSNGPTNRSHVVGFRLVLSPRDRRL